MPIINFKLASVNLYRSPVGNLEPLSAPPADFEDGERIGGPDELPVRSKRQHEKAAA